MRARGIILGCLAVCIAALAAPGVHADEIRLKDGQKLYGVIVAYEDNMFKVKTDFGFVLVEKDKIAAIIPTSPGSHPAAKSEPQPAKNPAPEKPPASKPATPASAAHKEAPIPATPAPTPVKSAAPLPASDVSKPPKTAKKEAPKSAPATPATTVTAAEPSAATKALPEKKSSPPSSSPATAETASAAKPSAATNIPVVTPIPPAKPKEIEPPTNREAVQGNMYINYSHGFRMYKAPSRGSN